MDKIPETMLITLWAKVTENEHRDPLLRDEKAVEIISKIDYDFSKFRKASFSQAGVCVRANLIDEEARAFIAAHPDTVVIQLSAGPDARYERLGCPPVTHWYELDLPKAIELYRRYSEETDIRMFLPMSLFSLTWTDLVQTYRKPLLIIIEDVLMYSTQKEVKDFMVKPCNELTEATFVLDMLTYVLAGHAKKHDSLGATDKDRRPESQWSEKEDAVVESWYPRIHLIKEYYVSEYDKGRYPFIFRMLYKIPYFYKRFNQRVVNLTIGRFTNHKYKLG